VELDLSKYVEAFSAESMEHLQHMEQLLLELERLPTDERAGPLNELFRSAHTLKGMAAAMEFTEAATLAHRLENALDTFRSGNAALTAEATDQMLAAVDALGRLTSAAVTGSAAEVDTEALCARLEAVVSGAQPPAPGEPTEPTREPERPAPASATGGAAQHERIESIRVKVDDLDALVDQVGELVTARSHLTDIGERIASEEMDEALDQLTQITSELQSQALRLRMVSVARVFDRFPRTVRDLTRELGKEVEFEVLGREIELDRVILDQLHEPLLHLLRNALDHGLESPAERTRLGKPPVGKLTLSARREREHVVVEVVDDGKGMDAEALRAKAVERGMLTSEEAALLTEAQVFLLVCAPGFSTVAQVTQLSGRGVGMDVVKTAVEAAGGTMEIVSELGKGTRFALHLPVTLAIIRVLLIRLGAEVYGMPLSNVQEAVSMEDVTLRTIGNREVTTIRDLVLPVLRTKKLLEVPEAPTNGGTPRVLVVEVGRQRVGMVVDGLLRQQEVVIKPLSSLVRQIRGFAGATILGDGRVVLVLDPATVLAHV